MNIATKWGLGSGIAVAAYSLVIKLNNWHTIKGVELLLFLFLIIAVIAACMLYAKSKNYSVNFGEIFSTGFRVTTLTALIVTAATFVSYTCIPSLKQNELQALRQAGEALHRPTEEINNYVKENDAHFFSLKSSKTLFPILMAGALFSLFAGVAISRINKK
jgi:Protein of unknown function (DUF4199)